MNEQRKLILESEMNPETNFLIPGGSGSKKAKRETLASDTSPGAEDRRMQSKEYNPLIIGSTAPPDVLEFVQTLQDKRK